MKKFFLWMILISLPVVPFLLADENPDAAAPAPPKSEGQSSDLVDLNEMRTASRTDDLARRIAELERDERSQDERIRSLERAVNDLQRRKD